MDGEVALLYLANMLNSLPALVSITFDSVRGRGVPWAAIKLCLAHPKITSMTCGPYADFTNPESTFSAEIIASTTVSLTAFAYKMPLWREIIASDRRIGSHKDMDQACACEAACLSALVPKMHSTVGNLTLPMETAPWSAMAEMSWPSLKELSIYGRYQDQSQADMLPIFLVSLSTMRRISILIARSDKIGRAPLLGSTETDTTPSALSGLQSLTLSYPDPTDAIFALDTTGLNHLSLRDWPRYYHHIGYGSRYGKKWGTPILSPSDCLTILMRMDMPALSSLELVYLSDGAGSDDELLRYVVSAFTELTHLEIHRYRADRVGGEIVDYVRTLRVRIGVCSY